MRSHRADRTPREYRDKTEYASADLKRWAKLVTSRPWKDAYVFFKHEDTVSAPQFAKQFAEML